MREQLQFSELQIFSQNVNRNYGYMDSVAHAAFNLLHERVLELPKFHLMCGDFNVHSSWWDPEGPKNNIHADHLEAVAEWVGLSLFLSEVAGPTHFPYNGELWPTVIDLMFVPDEEALVLWHTIIPEDRGTSDHAPLAITISAPGLQVPETQWAIHKNSDEEASFLENVASGLQPLLEWRGGSIVELESIVNSIASVFNRVWSNHAWKSHLGKRFKGWWTQECTDTLTVFQESRFSEDWTVYWRVVKLAKHGYTSTK